MKTIPYRRKREGRTDYKRRLALLKSRIPRLVVRRTNTQLLLQLVHYEHDGDKVVLGMGSASLAKHGWKHSTKSLPAGYLAGLRFGTLLREAKHEEVIVDFGLLRPIKGNRVYAAIKGVVDAGVKVHANEQVFPPEDRLLGKHISEGMAKEIETLKQKMLKA